MKELFGISLRMLVLRRMITLKVWAFTMRTISDGRLFSYQKRSASRTRMN